MTKSVLDVATLLIEKNYDGMKKFYAREIIELNQELKEIWKKMNSGDAFSIIDKFKNGLVEICADYGSVGTEDIRDILNDYRGFDFAKTIIESLPLENDLTLEEIPEWIKTFEEQSLKSKYKETAEKLSFAIVKFKLCR